MKQVHLFSALALVFIASTTLHAQQRTGGPYTLAPEISGTGSTGGSSVNGPYALDSVTGTSPATGGASGPYVANANFAGQLYNVVAIALSSAADPADEESTVQLTADLTMDDGTTLNAGLVGWSLVSGPVTGINNAGLASTGAVFQTTSAKIQAEQDGVSEFLIFNVADTNPDNYLEYGGDGLDDSWQFNFFGPPPNADAAPGANPDGDIQDNKFEFLSGYSPTDATEFFTYSVVAKSGSAVDIELSKMIPGTDYKLFSSPNLIFPATPDNTFNVGAETLDAIVQDNAAAGPAKDYRLELEKP